MAKDRSFASKVAKSAHLSVRHCTVCGDVVSMIKQVESRQKEDTASWGFKEKFIPVCKCNEKEVLG